jgi:hypothetical protein
MLPCALTAQDLDLKIPSMWHATCFARFVCRAEVCASWTHAVKMNLGATNRDHAIRTCQRMRQPTRAWQLSAVSDEYSALYAADIVRVQMVIPRLQSIADLQCLANCGC